MSQYVIAVLGIYPFYTDGAYYTSEIDSRHTRIFFIGFGNADYFSGNC